MKADLSGVWGTGSGWAYLYPSGKVRLFSDDCTVKQRATWEYENGLLMIRQKHFNEDLVIASVNVVKFEKNLLTFDTNLQWARLSKDMKGFC